MTIFELDEEVRTSFLAAYDMDDVPWSDDPTV